MQAELTAAPLGITEQDVSVPPTLRKLLRFNPEFNLHRAGSPGRTDVEAYIAKAFRKAYGAEVTEFAPFLMSMNCAGSISSAAGVRPASLGPLFLEQYLDGPIEQVLSERYGYRVQRDDIFELGNLASIRPGVCQLFYLILTGIMARTNMNHVVFAGTKQVAKGLNRLGFQLEYIMDADPARLNGAAESWGSYYANKPQVMAIDLRKSMEILGQMSLPSILLNLFEPQIAEQAEHFNTVYRLAAS